MSQSTFQPSLDVDLVRRDFPILQKALPKGISLCYLDSAATAQKPQVVIDKETEAYENYYANAYRGVYRFGALVDEALESTRVAVQHLLGAAEPEEIIFTSGSTMSINMAASGWCRRHLRAGDEILLSEMEHHANFVPWQQMALQHGAVCKFIPLTDDGRLDMRQLDRVLGPRTKVLTVSGMSNVLGTINPVKELTRRAHDVGAVVFTDAAQSVPHLATDVQDLGVDFLCFSGHKLYGPSGVGILYGRREHLEAMEPFLYGGHMIDRVFLDRTEWAALPARFEAGTLPIAQAIALEAAVKYVQQLGLANIHAHEQQLLETAFAKLSEIPGMRIYGPSREHKGAILSFTLEGAHPEDLAQLLDRRGVFVRHGHHCTMPLHDWLGVPATVRASFGCYNTVDEIDRLVEALDFARGRLRLK